MSDTKGNPKICNGKTANIIVTDACPHNHPDNCKQCSSKGYCWCMKNTAHIDLGCNAYKAITNWKDNIIIDYQFIN